MKINNYFLQNLSKEEELSIGGGIRARVSAYLHNGFGRFTWFTEDNTGKVNTGDLPLTGGPIFVSARAISGNRFALRFNFRRFVNNFRNSFRRYRR